MAKAKVDEIQKRGTLQRFPLDRIVPAGTENTRWAPPPREYIEGLKASIRRVGQLQHGLGILTPDKTVHLVDGDQRYLALSELKQEDARFDTMEVKVISGNETDAFYASIESNFKRANPSPMDKAKAFGEMINKFGKTIPETAEFFAVDDATVNEGLKLLTLDHELQQKIHEGRLTQADGLLFARMLPDKRAEVWQQAVQFAAERLGVTVEEMEQIHEEATAPEEDLTTELRPHQENALTALEQHNDDEVVRIPSGAGKTMAEPALVDPIPTPPAKRSPGKKTAAKKAGEGKGREIRKVTPTDLVRAARETDALPTQPTRKLKEVRQYFESRVQNGEPGTFLFEVARVGVQFIDGKFSEKAMDNRLNKAAARATTLLDYVVEAADTEPDDSPLGKLATLMLQYADGKIDVKKLDNQAYKLLNYEISGATVISNGDGKKKGRK